MNANTTTKKEMFNIHKAKFIQNNWNELKCEIIPYCKDDKSADMMKKQFDRFVNSYEMQDPNIAVRPVTYRQKYNNQGRLFADYAVSSQGIARPIRHSIVDELYVDVDIVNAHPNILLQMLKADGIDSPFLKEYCDNKSQYISYLTDKGMTKDEAKVSYLKIINKGDRKLDDRMPIFAYKLSMEMEQVQKHFCLGKYEQKYGDFVLYRTKAEEEKYRKKGRNLNGTVWNMQAKWMNFLICDKENQALNGIRLAFNDDERIILCFDGAMIPLELHDNIVKNGDYSAVQFKIYELSGLELKIDCKPFDLQLSIFKDPNFICPTYIPPEAEYWNDYTIFTGDDKEIKLETIDNWLKKVFTIIDGFGKKKLVRRKCMIQQLGKSSQKSSYFHIMDFDEAIKDMHVPLRVLNSKYDDMFYNENKHFKETNKIWKDTRMKRYLEYSIRSDGKYDLGNYVKDRAGNNVIEKMDSVDFSPYIGEDTSKSIKQMNLFTGFPNDSKKPNPSIDFEKSHLYSLLLEVLCNNNADELHHFLATIADKIQDPIEQKANAHILASEDGGVGKTLIVRWLSLVFGQDYVISIGNVKRYFEKFNEDTTCKLIKVFEEIGGKGALYSDELRGRLKDEITSAKERMEPKGGNVIQVNHCALYMMLTNDIHNAVKFDGGARRFTLHRMNCKYANNRDYFRPIIAEIIDTEFIVASFHYLKNYKYDKELVTHNFETLANKSEKISQMPTGLKFITEVIEESFREIDFEKESPSSHNFRFPWTTLNDRFKREYNSRHETLKRQLDDIGIKVQTFKQHREGNHPLKGVCLYPPHILEALRKKIRNNDFEFDFSIVDDNREDYDVNKIMERIRYLESELDKERQKLEYVTKKK